MLNYTIYLDLKMFALANSKELLNKISMIVSQKCVKVEAALMTFASVNENMQNWYAFELAKRKADTYTYEGYKEYLGYMPPDFLQSWKEAATECGQMLGNNGVVFFVFITELHHKITTMAIYSCPDGYDIVKPGNLESVWGRHFENQRSNPVYLIGKDLIPYELYHPPAYDNIDYSRYEDYPMNEIYEMIEEASEKRTSRAEKKRIENLLTTTPRKRKGYFLVTGLAPEIIPFGSNEDKSEEKQLETDHDQL